MAATADELKENDYPLSHVPDSVGVANCYDTYVNAPICATGRFQNEALGAVSAARLIAIDCEMVLVRGEEKMDGGWPLVKQLARVALVDEKRQVIFDEFVRPEYPVIDYLTEYSGGECRLCCLRCGAMSCLH